MARVAAAAPKDVPRVLAEWKRTTDPQAAEAEAERLHRLRALHLSEDWSGMLRLNGLLDPESGGVVHAAIRSLAEPANLDPADIRTPAQRQADALVGDLPPLPRRHTRHGEQPTPSEHHRPLGHPPGRPWGGRHRSGADPGRDRTAPRLRRHHQPVTLDDHGVPVSAGKARPRIPPPLRRALDLRDQHCTHPGCDMPARWCDAHHILHWADGGRTTLANLRLLCSRHHRTAHHHQPYPMRR